MGACQPLVRRGFAAGITQARGEIVAVSEKAGGSAPWTQDGVPPLSLTLRGGSLLYCSRGTVNLACCRSADANLGTNKIGVWGLRPQLGPGAEPLALPCLKETPPHSTPHPARSPPR